MPILFAAILMLAGGAVASGSSPPCKNGTAECKPWERDWRKEPNVFDQFDASRSVSGVDLRPALIPENFQGEWNAEIKDCGTGKNDSRLRVTANALLFYEAGGEVKRIIQHNNRAVTVKATFAGEGQVWDANQQLVLSRSGDTLTVNNDGSSFTRFRCPAH